MKRDDLLRVLSQHWAEMAHFGVASLALFGSTARDEAGPESDVDLLVDFQDQPTFDRFMDLKFYLEDLLDTHVDLVTRRSLRPGIRPTVEREAIRVP
jgi:predicted nucleotidyltransferase